MRIRRSLVAKLVLLTLLATLVVCGQAQAATDVRILPNGGTDVNMSCAGSPVVCVPTGTGALLDYGNLLTLLATDDVHIASGSGLAEAGDITFPLSFASPSTHALSIEAVGRATVHNLSLGGFGYIGTPGGTVSMDGTLSGKLGFFAPVTLTGNTTISGVQTSFSKRVDGAFALTTNTSSFTVFADAVGLGVALTSLTSSGAGSTQFDTAATSVRTTGAQSYAGNLSLQVSTQLNSSGGSITANGSVFGLNTTDSSFVSSTGTSFNGPTVSVGSLGVAGPATIASANILDTRGVSFSGAVTLAADVTVTTTATSRVVSFQTLNGAHALTLASTLPQTVGFNNAVGGSTPLTSITVGATTATVFNASVSTSGDQTYGSTLDIATGVRALTVGGTLTVQGNTTIGAFGGLTITGAGDLVGAVLPSFGATFTKAGAGTLRLHATDTLQAASVTAGTLRVDGPDSFVATLSGTSTLAGTGTTGAVAAGAGSTVDAGTTAGARGTLHIGNLAGTSSSVQEDITTADHDTLDVVGTVNLTTITLVPDVTSAPAAGAPFTIITNDGSDAVTGTFVGLAEGATFTSGGVLLRISYVGGTGNDVTLTNAAAVPPATSTTTLAQSSTSSTSGTNVTFTAQVTSTGTPTGAVQFLDGGTAIGSGAVDGAGQAQFATSSLSVGTHTITAQYAGDATHAASTTSSAVTHEVTATPVTTTTTTSPPVPVVLSERLSRIATSSSCVARRIRDLTATYDVRIAARVTYTLQRRVRPVTRIPGRCPEQSTTGASPVRFASVSSSTRRVDAGHQTFRLSQLTNVSRLRPGVYRLVVRAAPTNGTAAVSRSTTFLVLADH